LPSRHGSPVPGEPAPVPDRHPQTPLPNPQALRAQVQGMFTLLRTLHILAFVGSVAAAAFIAAGLMRPFLRRNAKETRQARLREAGCRFRAGGRPCAGTSRRASLVARRP
jgi:hypothetical protein